MDDNGFLKCREGPAGTRCPFEFSMLEKQDTQGGPSKVGHAALIAAGACAWEV